MVRAWCVLVLLSIAVVLGYLDRQILALLIEPVKQTLELSDFAIGALHGVAMSLCYALASIPMGRLIDTRNRRNLMIVCIVSWSVATVLCGLAENYWQLFGARMIVGVTEAGLFPVAYSLMADLFESRQRANANLVFYALGLIGSSGALALGGMVEGLVSEHHADIPGALGSLEPWRLTFIAVGLPGVLVAAAFLLFKEPGRLARPGDVDHRLRTLLEFLRRHRQTYGWLYTTIFGTSLALSAVVTWTATMLVRDHGFSVSDAGIGVGTVLCIGSVAGVVLSGLWNRSLVRQPGDGQMINILMISTAATLPVIVAMMFTASSTALLATVGVYILVLFLGYALIPTLLIAVSPPAARGQLMAVYVLSGMVGDAVQALIIGALSDHVFTGPRGLAQSVGSVATSGIIIGVASMVRVRTSFAATASSLQLTESRQ